MPPTLNDMLCALPFTGGLDACRPVPSMSSVAGNGLDCAQSGWRGREAECQAANQADRATFIRILEREKTTNPDLYRDWYEWHPAPDPDLPVPELDWKLYLGIGAAILVTVAILRK